ncbi:MAG: hypothetical protein EOP94_02200 [Zymomonas sp.]|nr:MAG: hypothetical protein EOP94_02200 [Zymomonas sp.]
MTGYVRMPSIEIEPLSSQLSFGCRIHGLGLHNVGNDDVRQVIGEAFEREGVIVFAGMDRSDELQMAVSGIFGPPQEYAFSDKLQIDPAAAQGLVEFNYEGNIAQGGGEPIVGWVPWHFDACYSDKLSRGGVLRALEIPPEGGDDRLCRRCTALQRHLAEPAQTVCGLAHPLSLHPRDVREPALRHARELSLDRDVGQGEGSVRSEEG